jgi:hypothetical protein
LFISPSSGIWIPHHHFSPFLIFKIWLWFTQSTSPQQLI